MRGDRIQSCAPPVFFKKLLIFSDFGWVQARRKLLTRENPVLTGGMLMNPLLVPVLAHTFSVSKETLFAASLFPYLGFLWFLTRSPQTPRLALWGFYGTLVFVAITIPAGIYAQVTYDDALANVDWLHGSAELFLTLSNILVVLGFRQALKAHSQTTTSDQASVPIDTPPRSSEQA
jgi:hypothetical protein